MQGKPVAHRCATEKDAGEKGILGFVKKESYMPPSTARATSFAGIGASGVRRFAPNDLELSEKREFPSSRARRGGWV
jgi:hypothetical protein